MNDRKINQLNSLPPNDQGNEMTFILVIRQMFLLTITRHAGLQVWWCDTGSLIFWDNPQISTLSTVSRAEQSYRFALQRRRLPQKITMQTWPWRYNGPNKLQRGNACCHVRFDGSSCVELDFHKIIPEQNMALASFNTIGHVSNKKQKCPRCLGRRGVYFRWSVVASLNGPHSTFTNWWGVNCMTSVAMVERPFNGNLHEKRHKR